MIKTHDIQNKKNTTKLLKIVSTQSSTKPGCIMLLSSIDAPSVFFLTTTAGNILFYNCFINPFPVSLFGLFQCTDNVLLVHAFNERFLVTKDSLFGTANTSQNLTIEQADISRCYLVLFEKVKSSLTRFSSSKIFHFLNISSFIALIFILVTYMKDFQVAHVVD